MVLIAMLPESPTVVLVHSIAQFNTGQVNRFVGFMGDRVGSQRPTAVTLKRDKAFKW